MTISQTQKILKHLKTGQSLTPIRALNWYGIMRLAARIIELREAGYNIETQMLVTRDGKRYATYRLKEEK